MSDKSTRLTIISATLSLLFAILVFEAVLRVFKYSFLPFVAVTHNPCIYIPDQEIGFRYQARSTDKLHRNFELDNMVHINSAGFHDVERPAGGYGEGRAVLAIGDSFTASIHVPVADTWSQVMERSLAGKPVVNLGISGSGTDAHLALLRENLGVYNPDTVVLAFFRNDIDDIARNKRYIECYDDYVIYFESEEQRDALRAFVDDKRPSGVTRWMFDRSYVFRVASRYLLPSGRLVRTNRVSPSMIGLEVADPPGPVRSLDELLSDFHALSIQHEFVLFVVPIPARDDPQASFHALVDNTSPEVRDRLNIVDVVRPLDALRRERGLDHRDLYWRFDGHFNAAGNELFGLALADVVSQANPPTE